MLGITCVHYSSTLHSLVPVLYALGHYRDIIDQNVLNRVQEVMSQLSDEDRNIIIKEILEKEFDFER